ncbi:E3 ubiquitin-protein ligase [Nymphaea thermarum]|nr:E3 ubiquitin-protein ligase [Nymphaea thermarum]
MRSHSTGYSLHPLESYEIFTLRLPENVQREIIYGQLNRMASCTSSRASRSERAPSVCLSELQDDDKLHLLPQCIHAFHPKCIDKKWFNY